MHRNFFNKRRGRFVSFFFYFLLAAIRAARFPCRVGLVLGEIWTAKRKTAISFVLCNNDGSIAEP